MFSRLSVFVPVSAQCLVEGLPYPRDHCFVGQPPANPCYGLVVLLVKVEAVFKVVLVVRLVLVCQRIRV